MAELRLEPARLLKSEFCSSNIECLADSSHNSAIYLFLLISLYSNSYMSDLNQVPLARVITANTWHSQGVGFGGRNLSPFKNCTDFHVESPSGSDDMKITKQLWN